MWSQSARRTSRLDASGQRRHRPDYMLLVITLVLLVVGLIVVYSISPGLAAQKGVSDNYYVSKQLIAVLLGMVAFGVVSQMPLGWWGKLQKPLIAAAGLATFIALILPASLEYPAHRWVRLGGLSLQSVEVVKLALVICLAAFLASKIRKNQITDQNRTLKPLLLLMGGLGFVVAVLQADLGSAAVLMVMAGAMAFVADLPMKRVVQIAAIVAVGVILAVMSSGYRRERVMTFLNPEADCQDAGYQACQALIAVGSGGLVGKGLSHGAQAYGYLPEAANDSIFAIMAEKFGFVGIIVVLCLFMALFSRLARILERAPSDSARLIVAGVLAWLSTQTLINVGAMIGLLPLKGITLPFISSGGTSIIFMLAAVGIVFNISRYTSYGVNVSSGGEGGRTPGRVPAVTYRTRGRA